MMENLFETAICYSAIVWVLLSWVKLVIKPEMKLYRFICSKCITFWTTLAFTFNPFTAAVAALIAMLIDTYQNNIKITL